MMVQCEGCRAVVSDEEISQCRGCGVWQCRGCDEVDHGCYEDDDEEYDPVVAWGKSTALRGLTDGQTHSGG